MKKLFALVFCFAVLLVTKSHATTAEYYVDAVSVEQTLNSGDQLDVANVEQAATALESLMGQGNEMTKVMAGDKKPVVAFILAWVVGFLGIHRAYLGTAGGVIVGYILTCGGLGIVALIDWIVLLLEVIEEKNFDKYVNNKKFFMFAN
ncbi:MULTISPECIES: TM2 domain-containing protein [Runella]|uniref:TM2 domain-containing membrane protein YozV n=1 Tax=Runella defluvii TaxID=370973 RepID=A0A7W5ZHN5_9BACT|nr:MULTISPECIES: TM2 domain-containing protein [Runella]MBB3837320.1 TM2 domain-containing membrane protein YozV [Runella defluvii]